MPSTSRWLVGSSSTTRSGSPISAAASATRRFSPPDSPSTRRVSEVVQRPARPGRRGPWGRRPIRARRRTGPSTTSRTRAPGGRRRPARGASGCSPPTRLTRPPCGSRRPARMSSSVVLPPPLSPTTPIRSPRSTPSETASRSTRDASPGTCAVTASRLTRFCARPSGVHRGPRDGPGVRRGSTIRAPGTGPCTTRTVRHTPTPASWAATSIALSAVRAEERARRPGARDDPGERAGVDPGAQGPAQLRESCSPRRPAGRCPGRAPAGAGRRPRRPRARARPAVPAGASPGCRDRGAGGPAPGRPHRWRDPPRCRAITQCCGWRESTGTIVSPRPVPSAVPPCRAKVTSLPSSRGHPGQLVSGQVELPQRRQADERARGVRAAPGHAAGDGDALAQHDADVRIPARVLGDQLDGAPGEVRAVRRHLADPLAVHLDRRVLGRRDRHLVEEAHGVEDRREVVVAVAPQRSDGQMQVDLGRDPHGDRWGTADSTGPPYVRAEPALLAEPGCSVRPGDGMLSRSPRRRARARGPEPGGAAGRTRHGRDTDQQHPGGQQQGLRHRRRERRRAARAAASPPRPPGRPTRRSGRTADSRVCISAAIPALPSTAPTWRVVL